MAKKEKRDVLIPYKFLPIFETLQKQGMTQQATELIVAIIKFDMNGDEPKFSDTCVSLVWESVIKPQLAENKQKYQEVSKARSEAVSTRYKQEITNATNEYKCSNSNQMNGKNTIATDIDYDVDIDIDNDIDSDLKEKINKKEKPQKHKYGQYQNVLLSDDELAKLKTEFPADWEERIERVSEYCASKGVTYKNYLATIRTWARKDRPSVVAKNDVQSGLAQALELLGEQNG